MPRLALALTPVLAMILATATATAAAAAPAYSKVLVIVEENSTYAAIAAASDAPYLTGLAHTYGSATDMTANYPEGCPSLAAYILLTSGTTAGICDDQGPRHHPLTVPNVFAQLDAAHRPWRNYAEDLPAPCASRNSKDGVFLVRHTAVPYFTTLRDSCRTGQTGLPALAADAAAGRLPDFALVTPNACHDMHGAPPCPRDRVAAGDRWLSTWVPRILAGPDYRAGKLIVIVTWDEGSDQSNHIPTVVVSPTTHTVVSTEPHNHCSTLRTVQDVLRLPPLACARTATSLAAAFNLAG
jgi:acid phosphatase